MRRLSRTAALAALLLSGCAHTDVEWRNALDPETSEPLELKLIKGCGSKIFVCFRITP